MWCSAGRLLCSQRGYGSYDSAQGERTAWRLPPEKHYLPWGPFLNLFVPNKDNLFTGFAVKQCRLGWAGNIFNCPLPTVPVTHDSRMDLGTGPLCPNICCPPPCSRCHPVNLCMAGPQPGICTPQFLTTYQASWLKGYYNISGRTGTCPGKCGEEGKDFWFLDIPKP